ncbi:MAG: DUF4159 domain-containing protein [Gammaproteobacteria bacterium]|nr:DUF4159 domain-containing protein [Gammaproteobacteria bacterium]
MGLVLHIALILTGLLLHGTAQAQREFRVYDSWEGEDSEVALPKDYAVPADVVIGRLMYPSGSGYFGRGRRGRGGFGGGDWRQGGTTWSVDYPRGERKLAQILKRLTTTDIRSVEPPVNPEDGDDVFYWPFLIVGLADNWQLTDGQAATLREYLLRGGFLFADSFFDMGGSWTQFEAGMRRVFPDRPIVDLSDDHPVFHVVYDLTEGTQIQIPNMNALMFRGNGFFGEGIGPRWRGVMDDQGRLMVLIAFNNDVSDSWQWADDPRYPAESASLGLRLGVNIVVYTLTH